MITPTRVSYAVLAATIILAGFLNLGAPLLVMLFSYFALRQLYYVTRRKWVALALFVVLVAAVVTVGAYHYTRGNFGVPGCGGHFHSFGQRMGAEAPDRVTVY